MIRLTQYIKRIANVILFALPGQYRKRKLKILEDMFRKSIHLLQKTGEPYWLDFGTLLGYHRSGGIIPHDVDIDIAMMESSYERVKELKNRMPRGLRYYDTSENHEGPKVYFSYKGYDFDIFFYKDEGETIRTFVEADYPNERQHIPKEIVFPLKTDTFLSEQITIPNDTKAYLELMYGFLGTGGWRDQKSGLWHPPAG